MIPVESSQIKAVGYDKNSKTMAVEFHSGGIYHYHDVHEDHHHGILKADSCGSYLHKHIKSAHKFTHQNKSKKD